MRRRKSKPITGRHVFWWLFGFFGVVLAMNLTMIYLGNKSWTGLTSENSSREGLRYNRILAEAERQKALGWSAEIELSPADEQGRRALVVVLRDAAGTGLDNLDIRGRAARPTSKRQDVDIRFTPVGNGRYRAELVLPLPGQWDILLRASAGKAVYRVRRRVVLD